jgi:hypothetical protein
MGEIQRLELKSHATAAQYQALRNDARSITADASTTTLNLQVARTKALDATLQLDRAPINGWIGPLGWSQIGAKFSANLSGLNVPQTLIDQTVADMHATAESAGVTSSDYQTLALDANLLRHSEQNLGRNSFVHVPNPGLYYSQHLRGFFRGIAAERKVNINALNRDVRDLTTQAGASSAQSATARHDVLLMEQIGGGITTSANAQLGDAYVAVFNAGSPSGQSIDQFEASARTILGSTALPTTLAKIARLGDDAPTFYVAVGASSFHVRQIVDGVQAVVADGLGSSPNPFKIEILRGPNGS